MNIKLKLLSIVAVTTLATSGFVYGQTVEKKRITVQAAQLESEELIAEPINSISNELQRFEVDSVKETINIPISVSEIQSSETDNPIVKEVSVHVQKVGDYETVIAIYQLKDGQNEIIVAQSANILGNEAIAVEDTKSWYNEKDVNVLKINGHAAVVEDSESRKQVHLITDSNFYTVSSPGTYNLKYLIEIAEQIDVK